MHRSPLTHAHTHPKRKKNGKLVDPLAVNRLPGAFVAHTHIHTIPMVDEPSDSRTHTPPHRYFKSKRALRVSTSVRSLARLSYAMPAARAESEREDSLRSGVYTGSRTAILSDNTRVLFFLSFLFVSVSVRVYIVVVVEVKEDLFAI